MTPIEPKPKHQIKKLPTTVSVRRKSAGLLSRKKSPATTSVQTTTPVVDEVQHHTPIRLIQLWKERWPILNHLRRCGMSNWPYSIDKGTNDPAHTGYYVYLPPGELDNHKTLWTNSAAVTQGVRDNPQHSELRAFRQRFDNQYFFGQALCAYADQRAAYNGQSVAFEELELSMRDGGPLSDMRTKLFALLHGWFEITLGGDPEFFAARDIDLPPFPKRHGYTGNFTKDGLAWELHTAPGVRCANNMLSAVQNNINDFCSRYADLSTKPRLDLTQDLIAKIDPKYLELGCNPSENVYGLTGDLGTAKYLNTRWAGGHIHFGLPEAFCRNHKVITQCVKNVDAIAGVFMVHLVGPWDCPERRLYYGQAGEFRVKPYGFEWRTPSNQIWRSSILMYFMLEIARLAVKMALAGLSYEDVDFKTTEAEVIATIQENNVALATAIVHRNMALYWSIFNSRSNYVLNYKPIGDFLYLGHKHPDMQEFSQKNLYTLWLQRSQIASMVRITDVDLTPYKEPKDNG